MTENPPSLASPVLNWRQASTRTADGSVIAYVMNGFPRLSETFIANEIHLLEEMGLRLRLYSVKREDEAIAHAVVGRIRSPLTYLPAASSLSGSFFPTWLARTLPAFAAAHLRLLRRRPLAYGATLAAAAAMCWRYRAAPLRPRKVFIKEFLQAGQIAADLIDRPEVRHLHGHFCHGVATITWLCSRLTGLPFSFTAHAKDIYQAELNPGDLLERKLDAARFVVTCTDANAQVLRARRRDPDGVHTIYHGLDTAAFTPRQAGAESMPIVLAVGRFVEKKGFATLIDACARLRRDGLVFRCIIVGERDSAYAAIVRQIAELDLGDTVLLREPMTQEALREAYRDARVFALPCQVMDNGDRDGIPNVIAEAMAMGVPVVSTRVSGIPELIEDGRHGLLVDSRDAESLALALRRVLREPDLHARLSRNGRERICECFDSQRTTLALRRLFVASLQGAQA